MCIYTHKYIHTNIYKIYKCMYDTFGISPSGKASLRAMGSALTGQSLHDYSHPRSFTSVTTGTTLLWWVLLCLKQTFVLTPCLCHPFAPHLCSPCDHPPPAPRVTLQPRLHPAEHPFWVPWEHSPWSQTATDMSQRRPSRLCRGTFYVGSRAGLVGSLWKEQFVAIAQEKYMQVLPDISLPLCSFHTDLGLSSLGLESGLWGRSLSVAFWKTYSFPGW